MGEILIGFFVVPFILILLFNAFSGSDAGPGSGGPRYHTKGCEPRNRLPNDQ